MNLTWLGQGGFLLDCDACRLVIDPYLSDRLGRLRNVRRLIPPPVSIAELAPDVVFVTHDHADHFDPETLVPLLEAFCDCPLIGPESVIEHAKQLGLAPERLQQIAPGQTVERSGYRLTATPARHSDRFAVGLLVEAGERLLYLSGDTLYDPTLGLGVQALARRIIDCALVCINGKLNNMDAACAARLMGELRPGLAIPMHYGLFAENTVEPDEFLALCQSIGQPTMTLMPGIPVRL